MWCYIIRWHRVIFSSLFTQDVMAHHHHKGECIQWGRLGNLNKVISRISVFVLSIMWRTVIIMFVCYTYILSVENCNASFLYGFSHTVSEDAGTSFLWEMFKNRGGKDFLVIFTYIAANQNDNSPSQCWKTAVHYFHEGRFENDSIVIFTSILAT